jgi:hypothetical protein
MAEAVPAPAAAETEWGVGDVVLGLYEVTGVWARAVWAASTACGTAAGTWIWR